MDHPAPSRTARTRSSQRRAFDVWNQVPLVPQLTGMSCWAAAAAMVVGWRDRVVVRPQDVAKGAGHWEAYRDGLDPKDVSALASTWKLTIEKPRTWTVAALRELLEEYGPLWLGEATPGLHSIVVTGAYGDGTEDGTWMRVNDPWPIGRGERYVLTFRELVANFDAATELVGAHAQLLHSGGRGGGPRRHRSYEERVSTTVTTSNREGTTMDTFSYGRPFSRGLATIAPGERYIVSSAFKTDPLKSHGGSGENVFLRWNELRDDVDAIDVVVHLHGYGGKKGRAMLDAAVLISGTELTGRKRPTLVIIPRGRKITAAERKKNPDANPNRYTFPGLLAAKGGGLEELVAHSLSWFAANVVGKADAALMVDRLILSAHSGGGAPLDRLLRNHTARRVCNPHEVYVYDATYGPRSGVIAWAASRIKADVAKGGGALRSDMAEEGGGLRVFYRSGRTEPHAKSIAGALGRGDLLGKAPYLALHYNVQRTSVRHNDIPRKYGPTLLGDVAAVVPDATAQGLRFQGARYGTPYGLFQRYHAGSMPLADTPVEEMTDAEVDELGAEAGYEAQAQAWDYAEPHGWEARAFAKWPADSLSVDLRHIQGWPGKSDAFSLSATELAALVAANRFVVPTTGKVLFGLRGCAIVSGGDGKFHSSVDLEEDIPDHIGLHCVLGVWDRDTDQIAVFQGSTVPNERFMKKQMRDKTKKTANMLLTGRYRFRVGKHRKIKGAFREADAKRIILRSFDDVQYTTTDTFRVHSPADNIHPTFETNLRRNWKVHYSSAGCLTVHGNASGSSHSDPKDGSPGWATFRERAGLSASSPSRENGKEFAFVLLTGREGWIASVEGVGQLSRLRFGSRGDEVEALQQHMTDHGFYTGKADGVMGAGTAHAWTEYQKARDGGHADGIVDPGDAVSMGFALNPVATGSAFGHRVRGRGARRSAGRGYRVGYGRRRAFAFVDKDSTQSEQSAEVRRRVARSTARAETGLKYHLVHDDSSRINFGIGSWTGTRIADLLDTYATFAAGKGKTAQLHSHFGGKTDFEDLRDRFRQDGVGTTMSKAERAELQALGNDTDLQGAQDEHLADDIKSDLDAIGSSPPWYPYIDGGMGAISEIAAHVLVHARHQAGGGGLKKIIRKTIAHFGGEADLGKGMVNGTITEKHVLEQIRDQVVARVKQKYKKGVRNRYNRLFRDHESSELAYYFDPE